jgi:hypothetical protein
MGGLPCHDNAVAESFFQLLKRERIKRHIYATRDDARAGVIDYIEMFYNSKRRHGFNDLLSPVEYESKFTERLVSVQRIGGDSVRTLLTTTFPTLLTSVQPLRRDRIYNP